MHHPREASTVGQWRLRRSVLTVVHGMLLAEAAGSRSCPPRAPSCRSAWIENLIVAVASSGSDRDGQIGLLIGDPTVQGDVVDIDITEVVEGVGHAPQPARHMALPFACRIDCEKWKICGADSANSLIRPVRALGPPRVAQLRSSSGEQASGGMSTRSAPTQTEPVSRRHPPRPPGRQRGR